MFEELDDNANTSFLDGLVISNRYEVIRCLGSGAMGSVHLARDRLLSGNVVALKVLKREIADDQNVRQRFLQEVKLMHRVNHPNVVRTYDVGVDHDLIYFTMEYVTGTSLAEFVDAGVADLDLFLNISLQICAGLGQIHAADIIHRDLKPANVMLSDGKVKIADFGVARSSRSELTQHKEIIGSTPYIAPEIWMGNKLTRAADFYSLGAIFFELLIGHPPFEHDVPATIMWMHLKKSPEEPKSIRPEIPEWLNALIMRMLAKSPENRPQTAEEIYNYINKRAKVTNTTKQESNEIDRIHFSAVDAQVISNLSSNNDDECAAITTSNSDLFIISAAPKSYDNNSYAEMVIKKYAEHAFDADGAITTASLTTALAEANSSLLTKRKENPSVTGISAALTALAITPTEIFLSFAGNCSAFSFGQEGLKRLNDPYQDSSSWFLGTSLPQTLETHKIHYSTGQQLRILLASPALLDSLGRKDIENVMEQEDFTLATNTLIAEGLRRRPHFSSALMLIETSKKGVSSISTGQVEMKIYAYDTKLRTTLIRDYKAFVNTDELDKTPKALVFDEIEKPKNLLFEDPKESIIFSSLPTSNDITKQEQTLSQFSKQRQSKIDIESIHKEELLAFETNKKQKTTLIILFMAVAVLTLAAVFVVSMLLSNKNKEKQAVIAKIQKEQAQLTGVFKSLRKVNILLNALSNETNVAVDQTSENINIKHPMFSSEALEQSLDLKKFENEVSVKSINLADILQGIDSFTVKANAHDKERYRTEMRIAELEAQILVASTTNQEQAKTNLITAQREYHFLSDIIKSLSSNVIAQRKKNVFWLELASNIDQKLLLPFAEELAARNWEDSPRKVEAQKVWQGFSEATNSNDDRKLKEAYAKLKNIMAEIIQISLKHESENLLKTLLFIEEARFKREIKQIQITLCRKGLKLDANFNLNDIKTELDRNIVTLSKIESKYTHNDMLIYRAMQSMDSN